jgi:hypothetical protein
VAVTGITSERYVHTLLVARTARTAIISLGVNDSDDIDTVENLMRLRRTVTAKSVYWLLAGANPRSRQAARLVAMKFHDRLIDVAPLAGPDHLHPDRAGYTKLAGLTHGAKGGNSGQQAGYHDFSSQGSVYRAFRDPGHGKAQYRTDGVPMSAAAPR